MSIATLLRRVRRMEAETAECIEPPPARDAAPDLDYTTWNRAFLPHLFAAEDGRMHLALDRLWEELRTRRGAKENILGHREAAKTTRTRPLIIRSALEGWEPYIILVMDSFEQAAQQLANIKHELEENRALAEAYPAAAGVGPKWRDGGRAASGRGSSGPCRARQYGPRSAAR